MARSILRDSRLGFLFVSLVFSSFLLSGCNSGSRGFDVPPPPPPPDVFIEDVTPDLGCAGDTITIIGYDFSLDIVENIVEFRENGPDPIVLRGVVTGATSSGVDPVLGLRTSLTVIVPTGVRSGTLSLVTGGIFAGTHSFVACPVVVGAAIGAGGDLGFISAPGGSLTPDTITFYGYNLAEVTSATVTDPAGNTESATVMTGTGGGNYTIPDGMAAVTLDLPTGSLTLNCAGGMGASVPFTFELFAAGGTGQPLPANPVQIQFTANPTETVPAYISGAIVPSGVRSGNIPITFNFCEQPAQDRWECVPHYRDPVTGMFVPCTPAAESRTDGTNVVPGVVVMESEIGALIGPGHPYTFIWDSRADLGDTLSTTVISLLAENPLPGTQIICPSAEWVTESIVIDNTSALSGDVVVFEDFETNQFEDTTQTDAFWNGDGLLVGNPLPGGIVATPTGDGFEDITLENGIFLFDTNIGELSDQTDPGNPIVLLDFNNNPGFVAGEFHVRTLEIEGSAQLQIFGFNPLVIRASGTGDPNDVAVRLAADLMVDGAAGADGTADLPGDGGIGLVGGHDGGRGGEVVVQPLLQLVELYAPAADGAGNGGEAGQGLTFVKASGTSNARAGSGGGGGNGQRGNDGTVQSSQPVFGALGRGGNVRGDVALTVLDGGSGGGGGGAVPVRTSPTAQLDSRNGGGGGAGGGAVEIVVAGSVEILGTISANGGDGGDGSSSQGGPGGAGSGGAIAVRASGNLVLGESSLLLARGGVGGGSGQFRGGDGGDGRIRLEANGGIDVPGLIDLDGLAPGLGSGHATLGVTADPFSGTPAGTVTDTGDGSDGPLDLTGVPSPVFIDTDTNEVTDANGVLVTTGLSAAPGVFNWSRLVVPDGSTLQGVGSNPLIMKVGGVVDGSATIRGTVDVSGSDGGEVDFAAPGGPIAGAGGAGGPGGGDGGPGGFDDGLGSAPGELGGFPAALPDELIDLVPPYDGVGGPGSPILVALATPALGGGTVSSVCSDTDPCKAGSGGGGGSGDTGDDATTVGASGEDGAGGSPFGSIFFMSPVDGSDLPVGGGGGGGGGGNANSGDGGVTPHSPGTGGGGGGGFLRLMVQGPLIVGADAQLLAEGGDAFQAANRGGNAGAGAGGGIHIQGAGLMIFESDSVTGFGPTISVLGGGANLAPGYVGNGEPSGGDGAAGRIRIESPVGVNAGAAPDCDTVPATGICPPPTIATFETFETVRSRSVSRPYPLFAIEAPIIGSPVTLSSAVVSEFPSPLPAGTLVRVLYSDARESTTTPGTPGEFGALVGDVSSLEGGEFIRTHVFLYSNPFTGAVPSVDDIFVDGSF